MSSTTVAVNLDKPLELIQKTYHLSNHPHEHPSAGNRPSIGKVSQAHPSRKTSVHDVQEATREEFNRTIMDIHEGLSRLNGILQTMNAAASIREEFGKVKIQLIVKLTEFISRLANEPNRGRSETNLKIQLSYNPQHLVYCVDYLRGELIKAQYLFTSLTLTASIGSSTLENLPVKSLSALNLQATCNPTSSPQINEDLAELQRDVASLEEHSSLLDQRFAPQISDWQTLENLPGRLLTMTAAATTTGTTATEEGKAGLASQRLGLVNAAGQKLSTASSTTSIERENFCTRLYRKCQMVCCICTPNYL